MTGHEIKKGHDLVTRHLWWVLFDHSYNAGLSTVMYEKQSGYVVTAIASIESVKAEIEHGLGRGSCVTAVHEATYLGRTLNAQGYDD